MDLQSDPFWSIRVNVFPISTSTNPKVKISGSDSAQSQLASGDASFQKYLDRLETLPSDTESDPLESALDVATIPTIDVAEANQFFQVDLTEPEISVEEATNLNGEISTKRLSIFNQSGLASGARNSLPDQIATPALRTAATAAPQATETINARTISTTGNARGLAVFEPPTNTFATAGPKLGSESTLLSGSDQESNADGVSPADTLSRVLASSVTTESAEIKSARIEPTLQIESKELNQTITLNAMTSGEASETQHTAPSRTSPIQIESARNDSIQQAASFVVEPSVSPAQTPEQHSSPSVNEPATENQASTDAYYETGVDTSPAAANSNRTVAEAVASSVPRHGYNNPSDNIETAELDITQDVTAVDSVIENNKFDLKQDRDQGHTPPDRNPSTPFEFSPLSHSDIFAANSNNQSSFQTFPQTVNDIVSPTVAAKSPALFDAAEISQPTSQLKVAILAQAASIANDSTHSIQVDLHPAELGHLQIRIEQTGDQLTAKIIATEIASSELLIQDRQHLVESLSELGFGEASVDITHGESRSQDREQESLPDSNFATTEGREKPIETVATSRSKSIGIDFVA